MTSCRATQAIWRNLIAIVVVVSSLFGLSIQTYGQRNEMPRQSDDEPQPGFKDFVRKPELFKALTETDEHEASRQFTEKELNSLVERLLDRDDREAHDLLRRAGAKAVPHLVRALADKRYQVIEESEYLPSSPLSRIANLIYEYNPANGVPYLAPLVHHDSEHVRAEAGSLLGRIGNDAAAEPVKAVLMDKDQHVRAMTLVGIKRSIEKKDASSKFKAELFDVLSTIVSDPREDSYQVFDYAPGLLLEIDRGRAAKVLMAAGMLAKDKPRVHEILKALNQTQIPIDRQRVVALLDLFRPEVDKYPQGGVYGELLIALARVDGSNAETQVREAVEWRKEHVSERAAAALCLIKGLPDPWSEVCRRLDKVGFSTLSVPEQHYLAVVWLQSEVNNGGFSQYFFNSSGETTKEAMDGLRAMSAKTTASILQRAMATFGSDGPARDRDERQRQLSELFDSQDPVLSSLDREFYKNEDDLDVKILVYVANHAESFRKAAE